jgi:hypothetical protein
MRYQVNAERQYRRAVEDFDRLKRLRPEMPNHLNIGAVPDVIDDIAPLKEINPIIRFETIRLEPKPCEAEPESWNCQVEPAAVAETFVESPTAAPDAPEDGAPLAPAAASTRKTQMPASRIPVSIRPEGGRLKAKPLASLRRTTNPRPAPASKTRRSASVPCRPACRPLANPAASNHPAASSPRPATPSPVSAPGAGTAGSPSPVQPILVRIIHIK